MSIFARWHRRRLAAKHWDQVKLDLACWQVPLNVGLLQVMHLDYAHKPTTGSWS
jgi:hypothetical protein